MCTLTCIRTVENDGRKEKEEAYSHCNTVSLCTGQRLAVEKQRNPRRVAINKLQGVT